MVRFQQEMVDARAYLKDRKQARRTEAGRGGFKIGGLGGCDCNGPPGLHVCGRQGLAGERPGLHALGRQWSDSEAVRRIEPEMKDELRRSKVDFKKRAKDEAKSTFTRNRFSALEEDGDEDEEEVSTINAVLDATVEVTVDSGASKSVWPSSKGGVKRSKLKKPVRLAAANGTEIAVMGEAELEFVRAGRTCSMKFLDANVKRPLASVSAIIDQGNRVVFDPYESYVENVATGQRLPMVRKRGVFVMELQTEAKKKKNVKKENGFMDVEEVGEEEEEAAAEEREDGGLEVEEVEEVGNGMWFRRRLDTEDMKVFRRQA